MSDNKKKESDSFKLLKDHNGNQIPFDITDDPDNLSIGELMVAENVLKKVKDDTYYQEGSDK